MMKSVGLLTRKPGLSHEEFVKRWYAIHAPLGHAVPGVHHYVQSHIVAERTRPDIPTTDVEIDGIAELWYADLETMERANATPEAKRLHADGALVHWADQELPRRGESHYPGSAGVNSMQRYLSGFGSEHASEALPGALPEGQNAPQRHPLGLYTEQISGTAFTAPRAQNRRSWLYRIRPSAAHPAYRRIDNGLLRSAPFNEAEPPPNRLRWNPLPFPDKPAEFLDALVTIGGNGDAGLRSGIAVHVYCATKSMDRRVFFNADGELLIVPQQGRLLLATEFGLIEAGPGEIAVVPRGVKFRVDLPEGQARGYVCENYGELFRLPELGRDRRQWACEPARFSDPGCHL